MLQMNFVENLMFLGNHKNGILIFKVHVDIQLNNDYRANALKSVSSQCAHGKSSIARKPEVHPEIVKG